MPRRKARTHLPKGRPARTEKILTMPQLDRRGKLAWRETHSRSTLSMLVSCVIHTSLFLVLATFYVAAQETQSNIVLQVALAGADEVALQFSELPTIDLPTSDFSSESTPQTQELALNVNAQLAQHQQTVNATLTSALAATSSRLGASGGIGGSGGAGAGAGEALSKLGANFFGTYAQGERFVFVLDSSRSMTGDRWIYACQELMDSVSSLEPHQQFYVICFDDRTTCMFNAPAVKAKFHQNDDSTRRLLKRWLSTKTLGPGTFPARAMIMALGMHPDAIFLLSDGELRDDTLVRLRTINGFSSERKQVPIHTVHLMSFDGRATLQTIALENSGTFTPVQGGQGF